ncbi:hypothetical protein [Methylophaga sp. OBS4]|uniref:hypothetical protein n=1 Tax=Methylophaga sp. OBS4 TaxID=2991935 RepID=UPI00225055F1|nr:hypothetical protein [Methylophaga sp. OBS4]MCX4187494.1 hypothetical protein [Methylophaga sp. OBS4]
MKIHTSKLCAVVLMMFIAHAANAQDWQPELITGDTSSKLFIIDLPEDLDISVLTRLAVELDGIDITAGLDFEGSNFTYTPVEPLAPGLHLVRLVILQADGRVEEKAQWQLNIDGQQHRSETEPAQAMTEQQRLAAEQWLRSSSFSSSNSVELSQRFAQSNIGAAPRHTILSGAGNTSAQFSGNNWQVNAQTNYFLQSEKGLSLTGESIDIGEYQIAAKHSGALLNSGFNMGHHSLGLNSQLFSAQQRRGISLKLADVNNRVSTRVFAFRPDSVVGNSHFTGVSDNNNRLDGFSASIKPFASDAQALKLTSLYYEGQGSNAGTGISGTDVESEGSGWSLGLDKGFFGGKLRMMGEYARASFDADGKAGLTEEDKSNALNFLLETRPFENLSFNSQPADLMLGIAYQKVDTFFASLANPGMAADRDMTSAYSNFYWNKFSANLQYSHETNNVEDLEGLPTDRLRNASWSGSYAFDPQQGKLSWLGSPYLQLSGFIARLDRADTPDNYQGFDTDNAASSTTFGGGSNYENWFWSASHTYADFDDHAGVSGDTISRFSSVGAGWRPSSRLSVNTDLQYGVFESQTQNETTYTTNLNFGLLSLLIPNKLDLGFNYNLNLAGGDNDSPDRQLINAEIGWTFITASQNNPGIAVAIRGAMERNHGNSAQTTNEDKYQLFAVLRVTAPFSGRR